MDARTCVITGGGKGMGEGISSVFARAGWHVLIASRSDSGLAARLGPRARFVQADVRRLEDLRAAARLALEWTGRLDAWVNNAGYSQWRSLERLDETFVDEMLAVNLKGALFGCKAAAEAMAGGGAIVNVSSLAGKRGSANNSVYCASKFAVNGVTQSLAKELGPRAIRVNAVCPVYVRTEGVLEALEEPGSPAGGAAVADYLEAFAAGNAALGRLPLAEEVGEACLYLAGDKASAITGQCLNVDCGVMPQ